jgi:hypothetical protein
MSESPDAAEVGDQGAEFEGRGCGFVLIGAARQRQELLEAVEVHAAGL